MPRPAKNKKDNGKNGYEDRGSGKRIGRLRGFKDILFDEYKYYDVVTKKAKELSAVYGFRRIDTPVLEDLSLYEKATGKQTDIVSKEMYNFIDKNNEKVALRPEATPGLVRAYIEHGMFNLPQPVKMSWIGPVFRHEKPQSGRWRQFTQFDLEIYGDESPIADAILILAGYNFYKELQIDVQVQINSIGCKSCRPQYTEKLIEFYKERGRRAKLCEDCKKRLQKNPLRMLDCKEEKCIELIEEAPQIVDFLCDGCRDHFIKVLEYLDELDINYNLSPFLVRGLDYYTKTVFEFWPAAEDKEGRDRDEDGGKRQNALGAGGRYDDLVEQMGGRPTPACGFGIGLERVVNKIKEYNIPLTPDSNTYVFVAQLGDQARRKAIVLFEELRRAGYRVRQAFTKDNLKLQLEEANRIGAKYCLILGQKELLDGTVLIRDMESGIQEVADIKKVNIELEKRMGAPANAANAQDNEAVTVLGPAGSMPVEAVPEKDPVRGRGRWGRKSAGTDDDALIGSDDDDYEGGSLEGFGRDDEDEKEPGEEKEQDRVREEGFGGYEY